MPKAADSRGSAFRLSPLPTLGERDFARLARLVEEETGIRMPPAKRSMLEGRLRRRLKARGMSDFGDYIRFLFEGGGLSSELVSLIDAVTTNKTDFYREPQHFRYLSETVLPLLAPPGAGHPLKAWSAGCSSGEEAYTLAMVLAEHQHRTPLFDFRILATDISTRVLDQALEGIYPEDRIEPLPSPWRRKYFLRSRDRAASLVRVAPEIRRHVRFARLNFLDPRWDQVEEMDLVFCRNVLIYFERALQASIVKRLLDQLRPGGYLFLGHSETLQGCGLELRPLAPMVYRKEGR